MLNPLLDPAHFYSSKFKHNFSPGPEFIVLLRELKPALKWG